MKRIMTAIAAAGFLVATVAPALAGSGCGGFRNQTVDHPQGDHKSVASSQQSLPTDQTASSTTLTTTTTTTSTE